eukprot:UN06120
MDAFVVVVVVVVVVKDQYADDVDDLR